MNADLKGAVIELVDVQSIIQVLCGLRVDCEHSALPEVLAGLDLALRNGPRGRRQAFRHVLTEAFVSEATVLEESVRLGFDVSNLA